jgi:hypothetical protein
MGQTADVFSVDSGKIATDIPASVAVRYYHLDIAIGDGEIQRGLFLPVADHGHLACILSHGTGHITYDKEGVVDQPQCIDIAKLRSLDSHVITGSEVDPGQGGL